MAVERRHRDPPAPITLNRTPSIHLNGDTGTDTCTKGEISAQRANETELHRAKKTLPRQNQAANEFPASA